MTKSGLQHDEQCSRFTAYAWLVWFIASLFYGLEYFQRVAPTVIAEPLIHTFNLSATELSFLTSLYLYTYAIAQIPVGVILDRYGARGSLTISCALIAVGSILFAMTHAIWLIAVSRMLIGFGSAFAFIGVLKLTGNWFVSSQYPIMVGLTNTLGVIGAIFGEAPFAYLVKKIGWQHSILATGIVGLVISALIWLFIKDHPNCLSKSTVHGICKEEYTDRNLKVILRDVLTDKQTWLTAIYAGLMVAPVIAFAELWAVPYLETSFHLSSVHAANLDSAIFVGIGIGGPVNGWISSKMKIRKNVMMVGNGMAFLLLLIILYGSNINYFLLLLALFAFGFFTSTMLLSFTFNKQRHPLAHNATVVAFTNMIIMLTGAFYQGIIGHLLDDTAHAPTDHVYSLINYHSALSILPATLVVSLLLLLFIRDEPPGLKTLDD